MPPIEQTTARERAATAVHEALSLLDVLSYLEMPRDTAQVVADAVLAALAQPSDSAWREQKVWWLLHIIDKMGGQSDASDSRFHWLSPFWDDGEPDTFNLAINRGLLRCGHDSDTDISTAYLTDAGRAFCAAPPSPAPDSKP